jgi:hypothetical protein
MEAVLEVAHVLEMTTNSLSRLFLGLEQVL